MTTQVLTPGPSTFSTITQLPQLIRDRLQWMMETQKKYGDIVRVPLGPRTSYIVFHPDYFRHVLVANAKNYCKGRSFEKTGAYMGNGIATSEGTAWQAQRRRMNPHFGRDALAPIAEVMISNIEKMLDRWSISVKLDETIDLSTEFQRLALEIVARALFGTEVPEQEILQVISAFRTALQYTTRRILNPFDFTENLPLPSNLRFKKAVEYMDQVVYRTIREERQRETPSGTLLALLMAAVDPETGEGMTEKQLRDEVMTLFLGGTDTSGNTLSWVFYYLNQLTPIRAKVLEEISQVLEGRRPRFEDTMGLGYTRRVVEETLRLSPQNWVMSRDTLGKDSIDGHEIPAGTTVFMGVYYAHRRPDFWNHPEVFDPNRFLPEQAKGRHALSYIPFGAGPRKCIGYQFALMEFSFAISMILQRFEVELVQPDRIKPYASWSLWPRPGILARLHQK